MNQTKSTYKKQDNITFFDNKKTLEKLNKLDNPLDKLSKAIDFEILSGT